MLISEFPYECGKIFLFMLFPASTIPGKNKFKRHTKNSDISDLIEQLSTDEGMRKLYDLLNIIETGSKKVTNFCVSPTFEVEKNLNIRELLQALGAEELLKPDAVVLNDNLAKDNQSVRFGNVVHCTHVWVTEEDTSASSMILIAEQSTIPNMKLVDAQTNSFVWLIYDKLHQIILFVGVFYAS